MIELLGWLSTGLVLAGYILNANNKRLGAMIAWIIGDLGWVTYDFYYGYKIPAAICISSPVKE